MSSCLAVFFPGSYINFEPKCSWYNIYLLIYIGQNTIGLYFMSGALPIVFSILVHKLLSGQSMLGMLIVFFASFIVGLGAVYLMNRFVPFLFDLRVLWKKASK